MVSRDDQPMNSTCKNTGDFPCWDTTTGACCGNSYEDDWNTSFSTYEYLQDILVKGYCEAGKWISREGPGLTYYDMWAEE